MTMAASDRRGMARGALASTAKGSRRRQARGGLRIFAGAFGLGGEEVLAVVVRIHAAGIEIPVEGRPVGLVHAPVEALVRVAGKGAGDLDPAVLFSRAMSRISSATSDADPGPG